MRPWNQFNKLKGFNHEWASNGGIQHSYDKSKPIYEAKFEIITVSQPPCNPCLLKERMTMNASFEKFLEPIWYRITYVANGIFRDSKILAYWSEYLILQTRNCSIVCLLQQEF